MRRFRAIIQTDKEPKDHEVIWYYKGKLLYFNEGKWEPFLLVDALEIPYKTEEDESISTVQEALDKLLYKPIGITSFILEQAGVYERGTIISSLSFSWNYNKKAIREQKLDIDGTYSSSMIIPNTTRQTKLYMDIKEDTIFTLSVRDSTNTVNSMSYIEFQDYIYYGTRNLSGTSLSRNKISPLNNEFTIKTNIGEYVWIFIPDSSGFTKIWSDNMDHTTDFIAESTEFKTDTDLLIPGTEYIARNSYTTDATFRLV